MQFSLRKTYFTILSAKNKEEILSEKGELLAFAFFFKGVKILKNFIVIIHYAVFLADRTENLHQLLIGWAGAVIAVTKVLDIFFFHTGEMPVQFFIKIFSVAIS